MSAPARLNVPLHDLRIAIVAEHASARFGGEAALPYHYFRVLRQRGYPVWLVVHARTRAELETLFPDEHRISFVEDSRWHLLLFRLSHYLPARIEFFTTGILLRLLTQFEQRRLVRRLVAEQGINVVHQPMPVSPRDPSILFGFGVPVVIGPMNGGMDYPPAFDRQQGRVIRSFVRCARLATGLANRLLPGKLRCAALLVANERTRRALPRGSNARVIELVENGVDMSLWSGTGIDDPPEDTGVADFLFMGRLVDWKAVDLLLDAFRKACERSAMSLTIVGDGPERAALEATCRTMGLELSVETRAGAVQFVGWKTQAECVSYLRRCRALVLPSLMECGGAVVLEAMAARRAVVATAWGGPTDYIDAGCGILIPPSSRTALVDGLAAAMAQLAASPELARHMGKLGHRKVVEQFDWEVKVDRILDVYRSVIAGG